MPVAAAVLVLVALDQAARIWAEHRALAQLRSEAEATASQRVAVLQSEIEKQRALPFILARDPDVERALTVGEPKVTAQLNEKLATLREGTRAGVIYLLRRDGLTIAASNYNTPTSFIGNNYAFRSYYQRAMEAGSGEEFAFGTTSRMPGLYLSRRIDGPSGALGVIVVKVEFEAIEAEWHRFAEPIFVVDDQGIVLVTSEPSWRFMTTVPIPHLQQAMIRNSLEFGEARLDLLPITPASGSERIVSARLPRAKSAAEFVKIEAAVPTTPWTLHLLAPTRPAVAIATTAAHLLVLLAAVVGLGGMTLWWVRRRNQQQQRARAEATRRELEERVKDRTAELESANLKLLDEIEERQRHQTMIQQLQDELVQANKLAVLGQITASVAHEINQPVAAIRTFAENGCALLARDDLDQARGNLSTIIGLTARIGAITGELRAFARKSPASISPVSLRATIDGALQLVGHRLQQQEVGFELNIEQGDIVVVADRMRLEQVIVNLLQNAIDALQGRLDPHICISAVASAKEAAVSLSDNGPGLPDAVLRSLFVPFTTTKETGLGLGLVICKEIIREFGGSFSASNCEGGGALFVLTLPRSV